MRKQVIGDGEIPTGVAARAAVRVPIPVVHKGMHIPGVQAVIAAIVLFVGIVRCGGHGCGDAFRRDLLLSLRKTISQRGHRTAVGFERNGAVRLLNLGVHLGLGVVGREIDIRAACHPCRPVPTLQLMRRR